MAEFLEQRIDDGDFPSAAYLAAQDGEARLQGACGYAVIEPEKIEAVVDTIYDLASVTKPLVTGLLIARLIERGSISLDQRVATLIDEFDIDGKRTITVRDLVAHTSNLPAWRPFYLTCAEPSEVLAQIAEIDLEMSGEAVTYSDLNFITLAAIIERFWGKPIDEIARETIFGPLDLTDTFFNPPAELRPRDRGLLAPWTGSENEKIEVVRHRRHQARRRKAAGFNQQLAVRREPRIPGAVRVEIEELNTHAKADRAEHVGARHGTRRRGGGVSLDGYRDTRANAQLRGVVEDGLGIPHGDVRVAESDRARTRGELKHDRSITLRLRVGDDRRERQ